MRGLIYLTIGSFFAVIFVAQVLLLLKPATDLDRACLNKSYSEIQRCVWGFRRGHE